MSGTRGAPRRWPTFVVVGAQVVLLVGLGLFALRFDWSAPLSEQLILLVGPILIVGGTAMWWRWGSRIALVLVDVWLVIYGFAVMMVIRTVDVGGPPPDFTYPSIIAVLWVVGGLVGAVGVWRTRR